MKSQYWIRRYDRVTSKFVQEFSVFLDDFDVVDIYPVTFITTETSGVTREIFSNLDWFLECDADEYLSNY